MGSRKKKQCSTQLQCEVPCAGTVVNSSLSSLSSTSHAVHRGGGLAIGGSRCGEVWVGEGGWGRGRVEGVGDISSTLPYTALPHGAP